MLAIAAPMIRAGDSPDARDAIEVRPPTRAELLPCRMILPEAFRTGGSPDLLLAVAPSPLRYLGVLSYRLVYQGGRLGWRVGLHVARAARRQGVGQRLIAEIAARGQRRGVAFLLAEAESDNSLASAFLASAGFRAASRCASYEGDLAQYRDVVVAIRDRLEARGKVPANTRVVLPREAPAEALDRLAAEQMARAFLPAEDLATDFWKRPSVRDSSVFLMLGDRAIGGAVAEMSGELATVSWRSVDPEFRGGWANILLSTGLADRLTALGVRRVRFSTTEETPDTENGVRIHGFDHRHVAEHHRLDLFETNP
jgi:GNAT superfamily N-acetyltransferase